MQPALSRVVCWPAIFVAFSLPAEDVFVRASQVGYRTRDTKNGLAFSRLPLPRSFILVSADSRRVVFEGRVRALKPSTWGAFRHHGELDFSALQQPGNYVLQVGDARSTALPVEDSAYDRMPDQLLEFLRQQRCGYNPWLDAVCHDRDGRSAYGPLPNGTLLDARGGWHDAADLLKYLLTSGNATAQLLLAYELAHSDAVRSTIVLEDHVDALGRMGTNGVPDVLDEARWGLEWMLKLHPNPDQLYHQVADDRDHAGWRLPPDEIADYGWGRGGARVVYFADGRPQGLQQHKSQSTGVANLAGRYAAAMGLAWQAFHWNPATSPFAAKCLKAGLEVYELGKV